MPIPHRRKLIATETVAASLFAEALPKVSRTRLAVEPVRFRCDTRCSAKKFVFPPDSKRAIATRAPGRTDSVE